MANKPTSTEERALTLLGQGIDPSIVASACGVSPSAISQLLSREDFARQVVELKYNSLVKNAGRDQKADDLEDMLLDKLKDSLQYVMDPMKILAAYTRINAAKRRAVSAPESLTNQQTVLSIVLPVQIVHSFVRNSANQVVTAGDTDLVTIQSGQMTKLLEQVQTTKQLGVTDVVPSDSPPRG